MNGKMQDLRLPFADVLVNMPLFGGDEGVAGRTNSYEISELTAILEGVGAILRDQASRKKDRCS